MEIKGWITPPREVMEKYVEKCKLFVENDEAFKEFKRDSDYGKILSADEPIVAKIAWDSLMFRQAEDFLNQNWQKFKENDLIGSPKFIKGLELSPSTLRYVNTVWEIKELLGDYQPQRILEIGGGYGGLCKSLSVIYNFEEYTNKDLPEAEKLFLKYLSNFPLKVNCEISGEYDLFIADSSLAECDEQTQLEYGQLAAQCKYIYIVYNTTHIASMEEVFKKLMALFKDFDGKVEFALNSPVLIIRFKKNGI